MGAGFRRPDAVPEVAARQAGVFSVAQAVAEGWTERTVRRRRADRAWTLVAGRGLRAAAETPPSGPSLAWAAQLTWPDAVSCGPTAGSVWGFPVPVPATAHVIAGRGRRARRIRAHDVPLDPGQVDVLGGLVVTDRFRTIVDCLATLPRPAALDLYAWVATRSLLDRDRFAHEIRCRFGRPGARQLAWLLRRTAGGAVSGAG